MVYSSNDMLAMVAELNVRRIGMVLGRRKKRMGGVMLMTEHQTSMVGTSRKLHQRFLMGDYRHDDKEMGTINELGNWLLEEHALNEHLLKVGTFPPLTVQRAASRTKLPPGRYNKLMRLVHEH